MIESVFKRFTAQADGWLKRLGGAFERAGRRPTMRLEDELVLSLGARSRAIPLALRRVEWEVRELNQTQLGRLRAALANPSDLNNHPHGATNGINIWINELVAKVGGASPQAAAAWREVHGPLMAELDRLQAKVNALQLRYAGGRYEPNPWIPLINLPHAEAARAAYRQRSAAPTRAEFEALAHEALALGEKLNAAMRG